MTLKEGWIEFRRRIKAKYPNARQSTAKGASNGPLFVENGLRAGLFNVDGVTSGRAVVLVTRIILPHQVVLHLGFAFDGADADAFVQRKEAVSASRGEARKVRAYLHLGKVYLRQGRDAEVIDPADATFGPGLTMTAAYFADVERDADLEPVETAHVTYIAALLGSTPVIRLGRQGSVAGGSALSPATIPVALLQSRVAGLDAVYAADLLVRYHVAMNHLRRKHFVLLSGVSGTGKTLLAKAYAFAVLDVPSLNLKAPEFFKIAVRPDWSDPSPLLGFVDAISGAYRRTDFVDALLAASQNPHRPIFVCLDEMNLAQPEHYFADLLSAMEDGDWLRLHREDVAVAGVPQLVQWPENLYITGTVNIDETTRPFSPKLLDRANVIDMSAVDLDTFAAALKNNNSSMGDVVDQMLPLFKELIAVLEPHALHFGYRTFEEAVRYVYFAAENTALADAIDIQIEQKVLTKLRGGPQQTAMLTSLKGSLASFPTSRKTVERMLRDLESYESFQYWS